MKKSVSLLLILTLLLSLFALTACNGAGFLANPSEGLEYLYHDDTETYEIIGIGTCRDTIIRIGNKKDGHEITVIADNVFENSPFIQEVHIAANITTIGNRAFAGCTNLKKVTFGKNVRSLGTECFANCLSLTKIDLPKTLVHIGARCFAQCSGVSLIRFNSLEGWWAGDEHIYVNDSRIVLRYIMEDYVEVEWNRNEDFDFFDYWINKIKNLL